MEQSEGSKRAWAHGQLLGQVTLALKAMHKIQFAPSASIGAQTQADICELHLIELRNLLRQTKVNPK